MRFKGGLLFAILLLNLFLISASPTEIKIDSYPEHEVHVNIIDPSSGETLNFYEHLKGMTDQDGKAAFVYTAEEGSFGITLLLKNGDSRVTYERLENTFYPGETIHLEAKKDGVEVLEVVEETEEVEETVASSNETQEIIEEEVQSNESSSLEITGNFVKELTEKIPSFAYYAIGILFVFAIAGFMMARSMGRHHKQLEEVPREIRVRKLSELKTSRESSNYDEDPRIIAAEEKIKEAQLELKKIKNEEKIKLLERKMEEDKARLERMRQGHDDEEDNK